MRAFFQDAWNRVTDKPGLKSGAVADDSFSISE
jgi:hypothetical protein